MNQEELLKETAYNPYATDAVPSASPYPAYAPSPAPQQQAYQPQYVPQQGYQPQQYAPQQQAYYQDQQNGGYPGQYTAASQQVYVNQNVQPYTIPRQQYSSGMICCLAFISFLCPLAGFILYCVHASSAPELAKPCLYAALTSFIMSLVIITLSYTLILV